jgi:hypothetical protein
LDRVSDTTGIPLITGDGVIGNPYAIVRWGNNGIMATATIDIGTGCQFTIGASSVIVSVGVELIETDVPRRVEISGMLSFYASNKSVPVTRTIRHLQLDPGESFTTFIPKFAYQFSVFRQEPQTIRISVNDVAGFALIHRYDDPAVHRYPYKIPIPNAARTLTITDAGFGEINDIVVVYDLYL